MIHGILGEIHYLDWRRRAPIISQHAAICGLSLLVVVAKSWSLDGNFSIATLWSLGAMAKPLRLSLLPSRY